MSHLQPRAPRAGPRLSFSHFSPKAGQAACSPLRLPGERRFAPRPPAPTQRPAPAAGEGSPPRAGSVPRPAAVPALRPQQARSGRVHMASGVQRRRAGSGAPTRLPPARPLPARPSPALRPASPPAATPAERHGTPGPPALARRRRGAARPLPPAPHPRLRTGTSPPPSGQDGRPRPDRTPARAAARSGRCPSGP